MKNERRKLKLLEKNLPHCHSVYNKSHMDYLGTAPTLPW
jgi:hypothetical protein